MSCDSRDSSASRLFGAVLAAPEPRCGRPLPTDRHRAPPTHTGRPSRVSGPPRDAFRRSDPILTSFSTRPPDAADRRSASGVVPRRALGLQPEAGFGARPASPARGQHRHRGASADPLRPRPARPRRADADRRGALARLRPRGEAHFRAGQPGQGGRRPLQDRPGAVRGRAAERRGRAGPHRRRPRCSPTSRPTAWRQLLPRQTASQAQYDTAYRGPEAGARPRSPAPRRPATGPSSTSSWTDVRAPISGRIGRALLTEGTLIEYGTTGISPRSSSSTRSTSTSPSRWAS